jgi:hypothetical protein
MLPRLIVALAIIIILAEPTVAASVTRLRVLTEDAYVNQCRDGICAIVQVTRSTFSNGEVETILLVSASDPSGSPIIPGSFTPIDSDLFVMNRQGTHASVNHPNAVVSWAANGLYTEEADSTTRVVDKRENPFTPPSAFRLTEKEHVRGATVDGIAGTSPTTVAIDTDDFPSASGFANAFITIRRTTRIDRILP